MLSGGPENAEDALADLVRQAGITIPDELARAIEEGNASGALKAVFELQATAGWFPPPAMLRQYEELRPGFTDELVAMAKQQAEHRQYLERFTIEGNSKRADRGQWFAGGLTILFLAAAVAFGFTGHPTQGLGVVALDVVGIASVFVVGRREQLRERREKRELMDQVDPTRKSGKATVDKQ